MNAGAIITQRSFWAPISVLLLFGFSTLLSQSSFVSKQPEIFIGITYDLTLLTPIIYLLIIWKSRIPNFTVLPVFLIGFLIASNTIPDHQRSHLDFIELVVVPLVEFTIIAFIVINVRKTIREIRLNRKSDSDLYSVLKISAGKVLDNEAVGKIFATEIAMIYFGLFRWKKNKTTQNQFTAYKENGIIAIFITLVFLVIVETFVVHLLLIKWNEPVAWVIFGLSIYAGVQLLGHTKALRNRFSELTDDRLILRYGLFGDAQIAYENIASVVLFKDELKGKSVKQLKMLGGLENHNLKIELHQKTRVESVYGTCKMADQILLHLDGSQEFIRIINEKINNNEEV